MRTDYKAINFTTGETTETYKMQHLAQDIKNIWKDNDKIKIYINNAEQFSGTLKEFKNMKKL